jgi:hypothetical protein
MKNSIGSVFLAFVLLMVLLSSCGPGQFLGPTLTPTSTPTITPTFTPTTTSTPEPTFTPTFTSTPEPTYTPIGTDVPLVTRVFQNEKFDDISSFGTKFVPDGNYSLSNGLLMLEDPLVSGDPWADGSARIFSTFTVKQGNGYLLLFRTKPKASFFVTFEFGPFNDPSYRAFWLESGQRYSVWSGPKLLISRSLSFQYQPETWYYLLMWLNADSIEGKIWEKDHPETNKTFRANIGTEWAGTQLLYSVNLPEGTVEIDEFQELEFSK